MRLRTSCILCIVALSYGKPVDTFLLGTQATPRSGLAGNGITDIRANLPRIWFGTGQGLSFTDDGGQNFFSLGPQQGLGRGSVSALWVSGDTIWVATAADTLTSVSESYLPMGSGLGVSIDNGVTWNHFPQPGPTPVQNLTYDIAVFRNTVWIVSWGGGVRKSDDWGETWQEAAPDSMLFNPGARLNHRGFSAVATEDAIWIGTAEGINRSQDNGLSWTNFNHYNQSQPISGNFVVALAYQRTLKQRVIWAATWKAEGENETYAVSKSHDDGRTWEIVLPGEKAHNFCFDDSVVYVAAESGLFKSIDYGKSWYIFPDIEDQQSSERVYNRDIYSAYARDNDLWAGTADGLARTTNNGYTWEIFRAFVPAGVDGQPRTFAYPNPFSPFRHNVLGEDGHVRIQYNALRFTRATIRIYDFAMDLVCTLIESRPVIGPGDFTQVWNGRNDYGDPVANGVYFYSVELENDGIYWGKIIVLN
ncbi:hypothetical protein JW992_09970 [candidate division KSB1 bacterium]|nr:hypothetical protein [candidate division KSB1 bacterium]